MPIKLPIRFKVTPLLLASLVVAVLSTGATVTAILFRPVVYPTPEMVQAFAATDMINLVIGVPFLLGTMWLARQNKLIGLLLWPGALLFIAYHAVVYIYVLPLSWMLLVYNAILVLSIYVLVALYAGIDTAIVAEQLRGRVPARMGGAVLAGLGMLILLRNLGVVATAILSESTIPGAELGVLISDFIFVPAWMIGGVLLWRGSALGYVLAPGLLFQATMLFVGLIAWLLLSPLIAGMPLALVDIAVIFIMGLICFIPFGLTARGVLASSIQDTP